MTTMSSIHQFFSDIGCHFQCYNTGRLIHAVDKQTFTDFEENNIAWQSPFLQHAWLAIVFWQEKPPIETSVNNHYVWFLKLPLDEQAKLNLAARDDFLRRLFEALGSYLDDAQHNKHQTTAAKLNSLESAMKDNPYGYQPKEEQLANFHAIVHKQFSLPASAYYHGTQHYLSDKSNFAQWSQLGLQGIADFATRLDEKYNDKSNEQLISDSITQLPSPPFQAFAMCLENQVISTQLTQAIYHKLQQAFEDPLEEENSTTNEHLELIALCTASVKASAQSADQDLHIQLLRSILNSSAGTNIEVLATIAGRCWPLIAHTEILSPFLEALANTNVINQETDYTPEQETIQRQAAFNTILSDLMFIPGMRTHILEKFRSPERSEQLTQAIGAFFSQGFSA
ncbi:MAG: DUF3549 family protein [gamma proteobacterium symbiont of Lucinoma myriamae]|nr:DUF3549 family protein [gamma proteobacterium symbiont of Lucinoma myriamae]MCU7819243.1 DUF3549 family protein [gamma proteobacterium symbiont of Lucinoma myriamae]MCU7832230.1 DUF3549 family protein [gamma proteobacterium symbiont of Lucinoma myriamae]